jgi:ankyrin repeat protein
LHCASAQEVRLLGRLQILLDFLFRNHNTGSPLLIWSEAVQKLKVAYCSYTQDTPEHTYMLADCRAGHATSLLVCCASGFIKLLPSSLDDNAHALRAVNSSDIPPLYNAAYWEHLDIVKGLLDLGCDYTMQDYDGDSACLHAVKNGQAMVVEVFLDQFPPNSRNSCHSLSQSLTITIHHKHLLGPTPRMLPSFDPSTKLRLQPANRQIKRLLPYYQAFAEFDSAVFRLYTTFNSILTPPHPHPHPSAHPAPAS